MVITGKGNRLCQEMPISWTSVDWNAIKNVLCSMKYLAVCLLILVLSACDKDQAKIQDCPEQKIVDSMPVIGPSGPRSYFIYNGERRELEEFDLEWVEAHCQVPVLVVY
jgi:hypothetical protein